MQCPKCGEELDKDYARKKERCMNCGAELTEYPKIINALVREEAKDNLKKKKVVEEAEKLAGKKKAKESTVPKKNIVTRISINKGEIKEKEEEKLEKPVGSTSKRINIKEVVPATVSEKKERKQQKEKKAAPVATKVISKEKEEERKPEIEKKIIPVPEINIYPEPVKEPVPESIPEPEPEDSVDYEWLAFHDEMTRLANRKAFRMRLNKVLQKDICIISLGINNLKTVNDRYGHKYGDVLITEVAAALDGVFPDECYRIGGDEFGVIQEGVEEKIIETSLLAFQDRLEELSQEDENGMVYEVAWGYAFGDGMLSRQDVLDRADSNMYQMKRKMKGMEQEEEPSEKEAADVETNSKIQLSGKIAKNILQERLLKQKQNAGEKESKKKDTKQKVQKKIYEEEVDYPFNADGFYDSTPIDGKFEADYISPIQILKLIGAGMGFLAFTIFLIYYV